MEKEELIKKLNRIIQKINYMYIQDFEEFVKDDIILTSEMNFTIDEMLDEIFDYFKRNDIYFIND